MIAGFHQSFAAAIGAKRVEVRDQYLQPGYEAQWCLFDSLLSVIFGRFYQDHEQQARYLQRAIAQLTPSNDCPELYFFKEGSWTPGPNTPLLWAEANLCLALNEGRRSLRILEPQENPGSV
jgi:phosphorylase kinase alpha/beta subunit